MISEVYWIDEEKVGNKQLGTMARPRGNDWLEDEIKSLKHGNVDVLISLLDSSEEFELGLSDEEELCNKWNIKFISFPIKDVNVPKNDNEFIRLVSKLSTQIKMNTRVVVHCRMGIGRASLLAAGIMIKLGIKGEEVFDKISQYRKLKVPDTDEQKNWILSIENKLSNEE